LSIKRQRPIGLTFGKSAELASIFHGTFQTYPLLGCFLEIFPFAYCDRSGQETNSMVFAAFVRTTPIIDNQQRLTAAGQNSEIL